MIFDPRHIALNVLVFWHKAPITLDKGLEKYEKEISSLSKKDKNLCNALVFGVLRHRGSLDWTLKSFSDIPLEKINITALYILRIALFQLMHMDRIPVFAVLDTAVNIAKKHRGRKTAGFINAVLRNAAENFLAVPLPDPTREPEKFICVKFSMPLWLVKRWIKAFGFNDTCSLGCQISRVPLITLRTNTLKTERKDLCQTDFLPAKNIQLTKYSDQGISFTNPGIPIREFKSFKLGMFQVQDEAAQIVTLFLSPRPGERILDACAGLGGKTGHIAQMMDNRGKLIACDLESKKLKILQSETKRLGIHIIQTKTLDLLKTSIKDFSGFFDRVLLDAPCTGLGVLQRNPDTKWKRTKNDIMRLCARQKKMLNSAANLVRPGGILVYAVCSCEKEENEAVIYHFLNKRKDFLIDKDLESDTYSILKTGFLTKEGFLKTYPKAKKMDGFFAARLKRK